MARFPTDDAAGPALVHETAWESLDLNFSAKDARLRATRSERRGNIFGEYPPGASSKLSQSAHLD
jgi:hypothetical protein